MQALDSHEKQKARYLSSRTTVPICHSSSRTQHATMHERNATAAAAAAYCKLSRNSRDSMRAAARAAARARAASRGEPRHVVVEHLGRLVAAVEEEDRALREALQRGA